MRERFMGDVYYYTALPWGGEGRGVGKKEQNIPFPLPLLWLYRSHIGGGDLCLNESSHGRCVFVKKHSIYLRWNKQYTREKVCLKKCKYK